MTGRRVFGRIPALMLLILLALQSNCTSVDKPCKSEKDCSRDNPFCCLGKCVPSPAYCEEKLIDKKKIPETPCYISCCTDSEGKDICRKKPPSEEFYIYTYYGCKRKDNSKCPERQGKCEIVKEAFKNPHILTVYEKNLLIFEREDRTIYKITPKNKKEIFYKDDSLDTPEIIAAGIMKVTLIKRINNKYQKYALVLVDTGSSDKPVIKALFLDDCNYQKGAIRDNEPKQLTLKINKDNMSAIFEGGSLWIVGRPTDGDSLELYKLDSGDIAFNIREIGKANNICKKNIPKDIAPPSNFSLDNTDNFVLINSLILGSKTEMKLLLFGKEDGERLQFILYNLEEQDKLLSAKKITLKYDEETKDLLSNLDIESFVSIKKSQRVEKGFYLFTNHNIYLMRLDSNTSKIILLKKISSQVPKKQELYRDYEVNTCREPVFTILDAVSDPSETDYDRIFFADRIGNFSVIRILGISSDFSNN